MSSLYPCYDHLNLAFIGLNSSLLVRHKPGLKSMSLAPQKKHFQSFESPIAQLRLLCGIRIRHVITLLVCSVWLSDVSSCEMPSLPRELPAVLTDIKPAKCDLTYVYIVSKMLISRDRVEEATPWLSVLVDNQWSLGHEHSKQFKTTHDAFVKKFSAFWQRKSMSHLEAMINQVDFFPEGIATDKKRKTLFVGSLLENKILLIDKNGATSFWPLPGERDESSVYGLFYDDDQNNLWVLRNSRPSKRSETTPAFSEVLVLDGIDGSVKHSKRSVLDEYSEFNSICKMSDKFFITDTGKKHLLSLTQTDMELATLHLSSDLYFPNGIACNEAEQKLYVSDALGIVEIDLNTNRFSRLNSPDGESLGGIDGLSLQSNNRLIAVQNSVGIPRVISVGLAADIKQQVSIKVLENATEVLGLPTTLALLNNQVYIVANSQIDLFSNYSVGDANHHAKLTPPKILRIDLSPN